MEERDAGTSRSSLPPLKSGVVHAATTGTSKCISNSSTWPQRDAAARAPQTARSYAEDKAKQRTSLMYSARPTHAKKSNGIKAGPVIAASSVTERVSLKYGAPLVSRGRLDSDAVRQQVVQDSHHRRLAPLHPPSEGQRSPRVSSTGAVPHYLGQREASEHSLNSLQQRLWGHAGAGAVVPYHAGGSLVVGSARCPTPPPPDASRWGQSTVVAEGQAGMEAVRVARQLLHRLLLQTTVPATHLADTVDMLASLGGETEGLTLPQVAAMAAVAQDSTLQMQQAATRAAVCAYLLHLVCKALPRHQESLQPYVDILIDYTFVSADTDVAGALQNGTAQNIDLEARLRQITEVNLTEMLYPTYTRKPLLLAHLELSRATVTLAHQVRGLQLHQQHIPRILATTHAAWMKVLMRAILKSWHQLCVERGVQEQKHRARWARRWTVERVRISLRRWRSYAAMLLRQAEADTAAKVLLAERTATIDRLRKGITAMDATSAELEESLRVRNEEDEAMTLSIRHQEEVYKALLRRVQEMNQVGTLTLKSLLIGEEVPLANVGSEVEDASLEAFLANGVLPPHAHRIQALRALLMWAQKRINTASLEYDQIFLEADGDAPAAGGEKEKKLVTEGEMARGRLRRVVGAEHCSLEYLFIGEEGHMEQSEGPVHLPLHCLLLLMRTFGDAKEKGRQLGEKGAGAADGDDLVVEEEDAPAIMVPSMDTIDTVALQDLVILEELDALEHAEKRDVGGGMSAGSSHGTSLVYRLSDDSQNKLQTMCRITIDAYEQLTGSACVVTAAQLFERERGPLLVLLAVLMRHSTNWLVRRSLGASGKEEANVSVASPVSVGEGSLRSKARSSLSMRDAQITAKIVEQQMKHGRKHVQFSEWTHPPQGHHDWLRLVQRQAAWVGLAFSAIHLTLEDHISSSVRPQRQTGTGGGSQDHVVRSVPLSEMAELLPQSPAHTMAYYMGVVRVLEKHASTIDLLFQTHALPLKEMRPDFFEEGTAIRRREDSYVVAHDLWSLLCDFGVAGGKKDGPSQGSVPLHRAAVLAVIETVAQKVSLANATGGSRVPSPGRRASREEGRGGGAAASLSGEVIACTPSQIKGGPHRPVPSFARALREDRHVDLRNNSGSLCLSFSQFVRTLVRCAHAWQCHQTSLAALEGVAEEEGKGHAGEEEGPTPMRELSASKAASRRRASFGSSCSSLTNASAGIVSKAAPERDRLFYEATEYGIPLHPTFLDTFLGSYVVPRFIGADRLSSSFQQELQRRAVRLLFVRYHDAIWNVFSLYQRPHEARGVRSALPPPFSTHLDGHVAHRQHSRRRSSTVPHRRSLASASVTPGMRRAASSVSQTSLNTAHGSMLDVGIVAVLSDVEVRVMAGEMGWVTDAPSPSASAFLTEAQLIHCVQHCAADVEREGMLLFFPEFLRLLCAVAMYFDPHPGRPLEEKLQRLVEKSIVPLDDA